MSTHPFHIADLIFRHICGTLSDAESVQLQQWLDASEENRDLFQKLSDKESYKTKAQLYKRFEKLQNYTKIHYHINLQRRKQLFIYMSTAAAIILLIVSVVLLMPGKQTPTQEIHVVRNTNLITPGTATAILQTATGKIVNLSSSQKLTPEGGANINHADNTLKYEEDKQLKAPASDEEVYNILSVPRGGEYKLMLSDGTHVWLNAESSIKYPVRFLKSQREVFVSGEAYFEVSPDEKKPFIVNAQNTQIRVLGTAFNLRAYLDEDITQTTLVKGIVSVENKTNARIIKPSEQYTYNQSTGQSVVKKVDIRLYTSWKEGIFLFNSQPLEQILNDISRWYDVRFEYSDDIIKSSVFSGRLKKYENANILLNLFEETGEVIFEKQGDVIYVKNKN